MIPFSKMRRTLVVFATLLVAATLATPVWAQGVFYREVEKDGRIYVFNNMRAYQQYVDGGEMGVAITLLGYGPHNETMVFDSEEAIHLYNFKHDRPGDPRPQPTPPPPATVTWRDGTTFTFPGLAQFRISNRIQPRFTFEQPDDSIQAAGTGARGDSKGSFRLRRAKFKIDGWFYRPELEFEIQLNWPDVSGTPPARFLEDANIDWDISRNKTFRVRFGQFKAPYGRQQITSSGAQQFVDRAQTDDRYNPGRETGLALWGTLGSTKLDWRVMASNGNGRTQTVNDNDKYLLSARVQYQLLGAVRMNQWASGPLITEGDLGDSAAAGGPLLAIAANGLRNDRRFTATTAVNDDTQWGGDYTFKYRGFASVGEYTHRKSTPYTGSTAGTRFNDDGFLVQASYAWKAPGFTGGAFWEAAVRYSQIDPSSARTGDKRTETGGALNYYYNKHNLKVQLDYRNLKDDAANTGQGTSSNEIRLQTQFIF